MSDRVCLLHAGTHKTGTTSLQLFFEANRDLLQSNGVYLARSGRHESFPGHHHIAWDLLASGKSSHLDGLLAELRNADCRTALLTSEDFSLLHARPDAIETLAGGLRSIGYRPMVLLYLRPQAGFAESIYVERIKHNYIRPLGTFLDEIASTGSYRVENSVIHLVFRYSQLLAPFAQAYGRENVIARPFDAAQGVAHIFKDFLAVLRAVDPEFAKLNLSLQVQTPKANDSLTFGGLLAAAHAPLHNGTARNPQISAPDLVRSVRGVVPDFPDQLLVSRFALIRRAEATRLLEAFAHDNETVASQYGARVPFLTPQDLAPENDALWARADIERRVYDTLLERWMSERSG